MILLCLCSTLRRLPWHSLFILQPRHAHRFTYYLSTGFSSNSTTTTTTTGILRCQPMSGELKEGTSSSVFLIGCTWRRNCCCHIAVIRQRFAGNGWRLQTETAVAGACFRLTGEEGTTTNIRMVGGRWSRQRTRWARSQRGATWECWMSLRYDKGRRWLWRVLWRSRIHR